VTGRWRYSLKLNMAQASRVDLYFT
jgi:hypothetical protein